MLTDEGVCWSRATRVCDMRNVGIICGRTRRRKRGTDEEIESVDINFDVYAVKVKEKAVDCDKVCTAIGIPARYCTARTCVSVYKRYLKAGVIHAKNKVEQLYR